MRFFGMYAPSETVRIAMYRKAGIHIGRVIEFGGNIWLGINYRNLINIEDDVILAGFTTILSHSFLFAARPEEYLFGSERARKDGYFPVIIKKGAKIGMHVVILPGVTIGENSVIGAGAVVASDIPPNCVAVGVPAKPVSFFGSTNAMSQNSIVRSAQEPSRHPVLYVKCKTCGVEFDSAMRCDEQILRTLDLRDNCHPCPNGHKNRYSKQDYYYRDRLKASE